MNRKLRGRGQNLALLAPFEAWLWRFQPMFQPQFDSKIIWDSRCTKDNDPLSWCKSDAWRQMSSSIHWDINSRVLSQSRSIPTKTAWTMHCTTMLSINQKSVRFSLTWAGASCPWSISSDGSQPAPHQSGSMNANVSWSRPGSAYSLNTCSSSNRDNSVGQTP